MTILEKLIKKKWMEYKMDRSIEYTPYYDSLWKTEGKKKLNELLHRKNMKRIKQWLKPITKKWLWK